MRKGSRRNDWTYGDVAYLIENAGRIPKREICRHLRRSSKSVERKAYHLRNQGIAIELRHHKSRIHICPACGSPSGRMGRDGICEPCRRREQLQTIHARIAELLPLLEQADRDVYEMSEAETSSRVEAQPKAPKVEGLAYYQREKELERHALEVEAVTVSNLKREIKAAQKRKERIEKKVKSMGVCI